MNNITKETFNGLTKTEQVVLVINSGKKLQTRNSKKHFIQLYQLSDLFVELLYERTKKIIIEINTPSNHSIIKNYEINGDEFYIPFS